MAPLFALALITSLTSSGVMLSIGRSAHRVTELPLKLALDDTTLPLVLENGVSEVLDDSSEARPL